MLEDRQNHSGAGGLARLGAPVSLTLHLSWRWHVKIEIGLGRPKNRTIIESKVASLKNSICKDRLSQLLRDVGGLNMMFSARFTQPPS